MAQANPQADPSPLPGKGNSELEQISAPVAPAKQTKQKAQSQKSIGVENVEETPQTISKEALENQAKQIEAQKDSQDQPDYSLVVYPQTGWKEPPGSQPGWQSYYLQVRFILKGGLSHRMSDVSSLSTDAFESGSQGDKKDRNDTALQALNSIFTDEGTTGKAHVNQNGLTNVFLTSEGQVFVKRSSLCSYTMPLAHYSTTKNQLKLIFLPNVKLSERCGDVPIGMELDIVSGQHEELLQKLYCDDFPKASYCSPSAEHWTIPEFKEA
ncbi:long-chain-fatty-acid-- ligase 5-like protein [Lasius niger]|uniref:Long-chain-fatty-acid--ligase 5-like protein n=1 Tax=Lasius niger TaxID=67767 RepID=A0A0J7KHZ1_LASNI|nr:long-chain-fatty-acid-- ligase 5-like protein [Lasius niger]